MDSRRVLSVVESGKDAQPFSPDLFESLKGLWKDKAVIKAYDRRSEFQVGDSAKYFFDDLDRINASTYRPTVGSDFPYPMFGCRCKTFYTLEFPQPVLCKSSSLSKAVYSGNFQL